MTPNLGGHPTTKHFWARWAERFPGEDATAAFGRAERLAFQKLAQWDRATGRGTKLVPENEYRRDPATDALFILVPREGGWLVMTVYRYERPRRAKAKWRRDDRRRGNRRPEPELVEEFA